MTRRDVDRLVDEAWAEYARLAPGLRHEPTLGGRMNLKLACLTVCMLRVLLAMEVERRYALELVADSAWKIYEQWGTLTRAVMRLLPPPLLAGFQREGFLTRHVVDDAGTVKLLFPFSSPSYVARIATDRPGISFDVLRCPVASYFRDQDAVDLCRAAWCDLDYPLAAAQGLRLLRTRTLVAGDDRCDFSFLPAASM